jgi:chromosome segregation ATPase
MEFSTIGVPLDFMAKPDLERMKTRLEQSLSQLTKQSEERRATIAEFQERLAQFESLYTEGVVSKKDLAGVKKELAEAQRTDVDVDQRLADVKSDLARVDKRLKALDKPAASKK